MSYNTFEINNGELTINNPVSAETIANLKAEDAYKDLVDMDIYLDADNWGESDTFNPEGIDYWSDY